MKLTDLKKQLNTMDKADLIALICRLYKGSKQCQSMIDVALCGDTAEEQLVVDCQKQIRAAFFGEKLSLKNACKVISDFKKVSRNQENVAELMLTYVECGVEFTNVYGDIDEAFYSSIESMFMDYVKLLNSMEHDGCYKNMQHGWQKCAIMQAISAGDSARRSPQRTMKFSGGRKMTE